MADLTMMEGRMATFLPFQDLTTLSLGSSGGEVVQSRSGHLDVADVPSIALHAEVLKLDTDGNLTLETAVSEEGPWKPLKNWSATADETIQLSVHYAAEYKLMRFLRWRFTRATGAGEVSFRMRYQVAGTGSGTGAMA